MSLQHVTERIRSAAQRAGRPPGDVTLVAVTKNRSLDQVRGLHDLGHRDFGENRVQEASRKLGSCREPGGWLAPPGSRLHLIGHLQGNKARAAVGIFDTIHSVHAADLAERLDRLAADPAVSRPSAGPLVVLAQVNTSGEAAKSGVSPQDLEPLLAFLAGLERLECRGLMTMATGGDRIGDERAARGCFIMLRQLAERHAALFGDPRRVELSMGMSQDFEVAIEEGATLVRIGTALFAPP